MSGPIGSGKTTIAKKIANEKGAILFSIDEQIKTLDQPIQNLQDYEKYYFGIREIIANVAAQILKRNVCVVFDFGGTKGHWSWLKPIADASNADIEVYNLIVPIEERRNRVRARNADPNAIFRFSDEEFDSKPKQSIPPEAHPGLKIIEVLN